jgi:hypothetical protein
MNIIGISTTSLSPGRRAMFDALGQSLGVSFEQRAFGDDRNVDAWIVLGADRRLVSELDRTTRPAYVVLDESELSSNGPSSAISFTSRAELPEVLRGQRVTSDDAVDARALPSWLVNVMPLAFKDGGAVWAIQERHGCRHHYVGLPVPELNEGDPLFRLFSAQRLAGLLPLVLFVRAVVDEGWEPPRLQASFMFDDPNLHWTSYGFINYQEMVRHADAGDYHVSFATIPLDAWFVHPPAGAIFKQSRDRISLLYHGNDHLSNELGRPQSADAMQCLLRQSLGRIAAMEERTGLEVARVMAPPHGACSETAIAAMGGLGFEAVCVSRGSLRFHNGTAAWTRTIGMKPCDVVAGLPIIPRFGLSPASRNDILIAAVLRQPIVPMTHHQAVADGYDLLDEMASYINSLGRVTWTDMRTISRALYSQKQDDSTLRVRMWSKQVSVPVPEGTTRIQLERPWLAAAEEKLFWRATSQDCRWNEVPWQAETIAVPAGATIEVASGPAAVATARDAGAGPTRLAPVARRLLTEGRDRALPSLHRIARKRA